MTATASNSRRKPRRRIEDDVPVIDSMTGRIVGRLGNISETGVLLNASEALNEDALYQLRFELTDNDQAMPVEAGVHILWQDAPSVAGHCWCGLRFINLPEAHRKVLLQWLKRPGGHYA